MVMVDQSYLQIYGLNNYGPTSDRSTTDWQIDHRTLDRPSFSHNHPILTYSITFPSFNTVPIIFPLSSHHCSIIFPKYHNKLRASQPPGLFLAGRQPGGPHTAVTGRAAGSQAGDAINGGFTIKHWEFSDLIRENGGYYGERHGDFAKLMRFLNGTSTTTGESQWVPTGKSRTTWVWINMTRGTMDFSILPGQMDHGCSKQELLVFSIAISTRDGQIMLDRHMP